MALSHEEEMRGRPCMTSYEVPVPLVVSFPGMEYNKVLIGGGFSSPFPPLSLGAVDMFASFLRPLPNFSMRILLLSFFSLFFLEQR